MFNKIKQLFSSKKDKANILEETSISYTIDKTNTVKVNVSIPEYNSEAIQDLSVLINTVHSNACLSTTVDMVKECLENDNQSELLVEFLLYITSMNSAKSKSDKSGKPCISPSDMIQ